MQLTLANPFKICVLVFFCTFVLTAEIRYCPDDYFFDTQHCEACEPNCACSSEGGCDQCIDGYTQFQGSCIQCPQASGSIYGTCTGCCSREEGTILSCIDCAQVPNMYSFLFSGRCILSEGCFEVDENGFCEICRQGFYTFDEKLCYQCDTSCKTCIDADNCLTCADGYYWKVDDGGLCTQCPQGCATCTDDGLCTSCLNEYYFYEDHCLECSSDCQICVDGSTCTECSEDTILVSNLCISCTDTTYGGSTGCLSCYQENNFIRCAECDGLYFLDTDNGVCRRCSDYIVGAERCRDETTPTQCANDYDPILTKRYYLVGITCVQNTKSCKKISDIYGNCSSCYPLYSLDSITGGCIECDFTGCLPDSSSVVSQVCTCTACDSGYYLVAPDCLPCTEPFCSTCPSDTCSACISGYYFDGTNCQIATSPNCLQSKLNSATLCAVCNDGFFLGTDQLCYACQNMCEQCTDRFTCTSCSDGSKLVTGLTAGTGTVDACIAYPSHCLEVQVINTDRLGCTLCEHGFYLKGDICLECSVQLGTLAYCEGLCPIDYLIQSLMIRVEDEPLLVKNLMQLMVLMLAMGFALIF